MVRLGLLIGSMLLFLISPAQQKMGAGELPTSPAMKNAAWGMSVKRLSDGKVIAEYNPDMALKPASVTKLFATAFSLKEKGKDYRYHTTVYYSNGIKNGVLEGNVIIDATGDPCLDSYYFPDCKFVGRLVEAIEKAGIKKIRGRILIREKIKTRELPGSWLWEDISNYYGARYMPFNYKDNSYRLRFRSGEAGTAAKLVSVVPAQPGISFENQVEASVKQSDDAWIFGGPYSKTMCVKGYIPQNRASFEIKGAMHRPDISFIAEVTGLLKQKGIAVDSQAVDNHAEVKLFSAVSPSVADIVYYTNKISVNFFAEALGHLVAAGDYNDGVHKLLREIGVDDSGVVLKDACGLSSRNVVPAQVFTDLLVWAERNVGETFVRSLPLAGGVDRLSETNGALNGMLNNGLSYYGRNDLLKNNLRAKTGSFAGVRSLAGYITNHSGERLAFTIMVNNYTGTSVQLQEFVRDFLLKIVKS